MLCKKCGTSVYEGISFCPNCGAQMDVLNSSVQSTYNSQSVVQQYQQPVYNQQPQVSNNSTYNNGGNNFNNNDNKASTGLIVGVLIAVIAAFGVIYFMFNDKDKDKDSNSNVTSNVVSKSNSNVTSNVVSNTTSQITSNKPSNVVSNKPSNKTSQVTSNKLSNKTSQVTSNKVSNKTSNKTNNNYFTTTYKGYKLQIPSKYRIYGTTTGTLELERKNKYNLAIVDIKDYSYNLYRNNLKKMDNEIEMGGFKVTEPSKIVTYNGVEFVIVRAKKDMLDAYTSCAKLTDSKIIMFSIIKLDNNPISTSLIADFAYTVKTAKVG